MAGSGKPNIPPVASSDRGETAPIRGVYVAGQNGVRRLFYKDNYSSPNLNSITLRLHEAEMRGDLIVHVIHVVGTWMKELGITSLSRGEFLEGVMGGNFLWRCPLWILEYWTKQADSSSG